MRALVVGAGVAGPVAALALHKAGIEVRVVERRPQPEPDTGSWFTIAPNGLDALAAVDVLPVVRELGSPTRTNVMLDARGRTLGRLSLGRPLDDGTPALTMRRGRLAAVLAEECVRRGVPVEYGRDHDPADRGDADVVIAADGVHSRVRTWLDPAAPPARYVGLVNFGGTTRIEDLDPATRAALGESESWQFVFGSRCFWGHHVTPWGEVAWFVNQPRAMTTPEERATTTPEGWQRQLAGLVEPGVARSLVEAGVVELAGDNTHDLGHVPTWHDGSTVLIGDAAHAPSPSSGQGASLAAEDAVSIALALRDAPDVPTALARYEAARRERVEKIVAVGARSSSSKIPGRFGRGFRDLTMRAVFRWLVTEKSTAWMYDHRVPWDVPTGGASARSAGSA